LYIFFNIYLKLILNLLISLLEEGKWGLGIGDWGLGIGDWGLGPIPNPQSPIPNPQSPSSRSEIKRFKINFK
jgi:hypothetical protein